MSLQFLSRFFFCYSAIRDRNFVYQVSIVTRINKKKSARRLKQPIIEFLSTEHCCAARSNEFLFKAELFLASVPYRKFRTWNRTVFFVLSWKRPESYPFLCRGFKVKINVENSTRIQKGDSTWELQCLSMSVVTYRNLWKLLVFVFAKPLANSILLREVARNLSCRIHGRPPNICILSISCASQEKTRICLYDIYMWFLPPQHDVPYTQPLTLTLSISRERNTQKRGSQCEPTFKWH